MPFHSELIVRESPAADGRAWLLAEPLAYEGKRDRFPVPVGFETDFASVPRPLWPLFPPTGRYTRAAVLHDWLYTAAPLVRLPLRPKDERDEWVQVEPRPAGAPLPGVEWIQDYAPITRADADGLFRRVMRELGVSGWRRWTMWAAVRLGGWRYWRRARAAQVAREAAEADAAREREIVEAVRRHESAAGAPEAKDAVGEGAEGQRP